MSFTKREHWTEEDIRDYLGGEQNFFDRKSGSLMIDPHEFRKKLAKVICAFANSGGGYVFLGVEDDGRFTGVSTIHKGRQSMKDHLEKLIPDLLSYPLQDYRVYAVRDKENSTIPDDKVIIVIEVGDSPLAPHQVAARDIRIYYYREGSNSEPAPHFYLEMLRNRLVSPMLTAELVSVNLIRIEDPHHRTDVYPLIRFNFRIANVGRVAAYRWAHVIEELINVNPHYAEDYNWDSLEHRTPPTDLTILPGLEINFVRELHIGFQPKTHDVRGYMEYLKVYFPNDLALRHRVVTETSPGETQEVPLHSFIDLKTWTQRIVEEKQWPRPPRSGTRYA